jgi:fatty acid desaturase
MGAVTFIDSVKFWIAQALVSIFGIVGIVVLIFAVILVWVTIQEHVIKPYKERNKP